jgi:magnesium transporter
MEMGRVGRVRSAFSDLRSGDAALLFRALPESLRVDILLTLTPPIAADILEELPDDLAAALVMQISPESAAPIVQEMRTDEETDLLQDISADRAEQILQRVEERDASVARSLLAYHEDSAGGLMESDFIAFSEDMTASEAVQRLRQRADEYEEYPASYLYTVDKNGRLVGVLSLRALIMCQGETPIDSITTRDVVAAPAEMQGQELIKLFRRYHFMAIPVVDASERLIGVVTQDDALRFAEKDADEEMLRLTGIVGGDEFRDMKLRSRSWRRLSWLSINILLNVLAASVIAFYQETVRAVIALAVFLPIISDMSGCSGNQAVAVSIRELSLDRIAPRNFFWVFRKELAVGLINGLVLGLIVAVIAWLWKANVVLGLVVGAALWINTLVAVTIGGLTPLLLRRLRQDPAIASGPILTTLTDMCGFLVVLVLASHFVHLLH